MADTPRQLLVIDHVNDRRFGHQICGVLCDSCNSLMGMVDGTKRWRNDRRTEPAARGCAENPWCRNSGIST